jgi:hypothetical protein
MSDLPREEVEKRCEELLSRVYFGIHHVPYWEKRKEWGSGLKVTVPNSLASYDFDYLTRLVVAAHDLCIRVQVTPAGPKQLSIEMHPRSGREGKTWDRHPTIEDAVSRIREYKANP